MLGGPSLLVFNNEYYEAGHLATTDFGVGWHPTMVTVQDHGELLRRFPVEGVEDLGPARP